MKWREAVEEPPGSWRGQLFRGHYRHTIDTKGRLSIPSRFRDVLASGWGDKLVIVPNGKGLDVHPLQWWEELEGKVDALPQLDPDARLFRYKYLSQGQDVELDPQGRILMAFGEEGSDPGQFWLPAGICIDGHGRIYVADSYNKRIQIFELLKELQP